ncbi:hypothetical protein ACLB2K_035605 [Fragaria x ananassa]
MASLSGHTMVLMLLLLFAMAVSGEDSTLALRKRRFVNITNDLWSGVDITVHCKSGDDDLGEHTLPHGVTYGFNFRPRTFPATTLFFCSFRFQSLTGTPVNMTNALLPGIAQRLTLLTNVDHFRS